MKFSAFIIGFTLLVTSCASPSSPYITDCTQPECERRAAEKTLEISPTDGVKVTVNTNFYFKIDRAPENILHHNDLLVLTFPDETQIASATLSVNDFGLTNSDLSAYTLLNLAFMEKFSLLPDNLGPAERHVIRSIKLDALSNDGAEQYITGNTTIYFYSESDSKHKAYVVSGQREFSWSMLDLYGLTADNARALLATIVQF